ncbi:hypothetical protein VSDG_01123 [Cytospora chrysosperma]|uniref:Uncharacterized protein n=1 Tax=Cytospora chrysosperma TaxID=252740 RepID=A0A423WLC4_CYTCH|nr:hypothetical protein VSDG_01123 [Valsa sordida]
MPPKAAKRKAKGSKDDDPWRSPDDHLRKKPRPSTAVVDEVDEDQYQAKRPANNQFQTWSDWQTKFNEKEKSDKRDFANAFNRNIEAKRNEFDALFSRSNDELINADNKYAMLIEEPCTDTQTASKSNPKVQAAKSRQDHPLFKAGQHILQKCHNLVADHGKASKKATQGSTKATLPRELWEDEIASVQELLLYGRQHGENIVECIVVPSPSDEEKSHLLTPDKEELSLTGKLAVAMYRKSAEGVMKGGPTWGEVARSQAGAFGRALDGLTGI